MNHYRWRKIAMRSLACVVLLATAGCANRDVELDRANLEGVHEVAVIGPADPDMLIIRTQAVANRQVVEVGALSLFGAVGGLVAGAAIASETDAMSKPLNDEVTKQHYHLGASLQDAFESALKNGGYQVVRANVKRSSAMGFADKYDGIDPHADLVLDAVASAAFTNIDSGSKQHFRPIVSVVVKLVLLKNNKTIMRKTFVYDDAVEHPTAFQVVGDPQYDMDTYKRVEASTPQCLAGIDAGVAPLAKAVVAVMAPGSAASATPAQPATPSAPAPDAPHAPTQSTPQSSTSP